jgi:hypothetical protein
MMNDEFGKTKVYYTKVNIYSVKGKCSPLLPAPPKAWGEGLGVRFFWTKLFLYLVLVMPKIYNAKNI